MDVKELRLGDWVSSYYRGHCKVLSIDSDKVRVIDRNGEEEDLNAESLKPVNLTIHLFSSNNFNKVLGWKHGTFELKMGMMSEKYVGVFPLARQTFYVEMENSVDNRFMKARVGFVHELQHLFQDFRIDKEIELWT